MATINAEYVAWITLAHLVFFEIKRLSTDASEPNIPNNPQNPRSATATPNFLLTYVCVNTDRSY
ncbi:hypothetical protein D3C84_1127140 [compost metagenome]